MTEFGRVGHLVATLNDCYFVVVSPSDNPKIRQWAPTFWRVMILSGYGWLGQPLGPGEMGAVKTDSPDIEWLDD